MPNKEIQAKIEAYIQGGLSQEEVEHLWATILAEPDYMEYLETLANLNSLYNEAGQIKRIVRPKRLWYSIAALIILLAGLLFLLKKEYQPSSVALSAVPSDEFESARVTRSASSTPVKFDSLLNLGYGAFVEGDTSKALRYFKRLTRNETHSAVVIKAYLDLGIIYYNEHEFTSAAHAFKNSMARSRATPLYFEKSLWLLANSYIRMGQTDSAVIILDKSKNGEGVYIKKIDQLLQKLQDGDGGSKQKDPN